MTAVVLPMPPEPVRINELMSEEEMSDTNLEIKSNRSEGEYSHGTEADGTEAGEDIDSAFRITYSRCSRLVRVTFFPEIIAEYFPDSNLISMIEIFL